MDTSYEKLVKRAATSAIVLASILLFIKLIAWWYTGAISLLASLLDSSIDLLASGLNLLIIRYALQPADKGHTFGHGKAESLAALAQSAFIVGSAAFLLLSSAKHLMNPVPLNFPVFGIIVTSISLVFTICLVSYQSYVIKKTGSQAIKADRLHYQSDLFMNIGVIIALVLSWNGFLYADAILAIIIGCYILFSAFKIAFSAIQLLLDCALPEEENKRIREIAESFTPVNGVHEIRTRQSGKTKFIQLHLELDDNMRLVDAHSIADKVEHALLKEFPDSEIIIHQDPISSIEYERERELF
ncbi:cation diffusion facilitator family transporter [Zophobihabitans entericus]|uniref:Cation-efflux pump FieF n=1 Tax=Zophobihabitans entericus TaxID=1635327 RepID=A0A6G9I8V3_9GAMM|nr:cation diffusion facilitator family transporter [Zophobihabitans entericus]QIQ20287.1 cation diffusion facilitator family transporter [Zophobihabitans entericus]